MALMPKSLTIQVYFPIDEEEKLAFFFFLLEVPTGSIQGEICSCKILSQKQKHFHQKYSK